MGQYRFDHLSTIDGLSQNSVNDIFQDSEGFIWLATQEGLNRYDGYEFVKYTMEGEMDMAGNFLWSIVEDSNGNIWTASSNGATRLDWRNGYSTHFRISTDEKFRGQKNQVLRVYDVGDKVAIAYADGAFGVDPLDFYDSAEVLLNDQHIMCSGVNPEGKRFYNSISFQEEDYILSEIHLIGQDSIPLPAGYRCSRFKSALFSWTNGIFVGTNNGLLHFNANEHQFEIIPCITDGVNEIIWGPANQELWVATDNGIILFNPNSMSCVGKIQSGDGENDLTSNVVAALMKDKEGIIWIGTANGGVNIYDPMKDRFKFLTKENGFSDKAAWSVFQTEKYLLVGVDNGLYVGKLKAKLTDYLFARDAISSIEKIRIPPLRENRITAIEQLSENVFIIGTFDEKIVRINLETGSYRVEKLSQNSISPHIVSAIKRIGNEIWVTTHNGLFLFTDALEFKEFFNHHEKPTAIPTNYYLSAYSSMDGTLWAGNNIGFYTISPKKEIKVFPYIKDQPEKGPAFNFVSGFFEDKEGKMWISTFGGGVSVFDREAGEFVHINKSDGLANDICSAISGNDSEIYVSTNGGISKIDLDTHEITNFNTSDGILNNEFAIASVHRLANTFAFGNVNGLVIFNADDVSDSISLSAPIITKMTANYKEAARSRINNSTLEISPKDKIFSLEFSNMSFREKDKVTYQYSLTNFNVGWVDAEPYERRATYSLPPGDYMFNVRTKNGRYISKTQTLSIVVHPAFYQTWWFYSLVALSALLGIFFLVKYYSNQQLRSKLRKMEVQQRIQNERERISRDLHDNVGSQITYIATSINNLSGVGSQEELKELGEFTRDTMRQLRETIWVINNDEVSLEELKTKVLDFLSEILQPHPEVFHEVSFPESTDKLNPTVAINIFRLIQEAVNNSVKHGKPNKIKITLEIGESCQLIISDDGVGFSGEDKIGHFGLINMRKRARELGAEYELISSAGKGTQIVLRNFKIGQMS